MNKNISGGVNAAKGFMANGLNAGIKNNVKKDMALVYSEKPCVAAGVFTTNKVKAAPVKWDYNVPMPVREKKDTVTVWIWLKR